MRQVEKDGCCGRLKGNYEGMVKNNEGNLILNGNRANCGCYSTL